MRGHHHRPAGERVERLGQVGARAVDHAAGRQQVGHDIFRQIEAREQGRAVERARRRDEPRHRDRVARDAAGELRADEVLRIDHRGREDERFGIMLADPFQPRRRMERVVMRRLGAELRIDRVARRDLLRARVARGDRAGERIAELVEHDRRARHAGDRDRLGREECLLVVALEAARGRAQAAPPFGRQDQPAHARRRRRNIGERRHVTCLGHQGGFHRGAAEIRREDDGHGVPPGVSLPRLRGRAGRGQAVLFAGLTPSRLLPRRPPAAGMHRPWHGRADERFSIMNI